MVGFRNGPLYSSVPDQDLEDGLPLPVTSSGHVQQSGRSSSGWSNGWATPSEPRATYPSNTDLPISSVKGKGRVKNATAKTQTGRSARARSRDLEWQSDGTEDHGDSRDELEEDEEQIQAPLGMLFSIRFTDGSPDLLDMYVSAHESVRDVKKRIRLMKPETALAADGRPRRLRLIQLGRLMTDGTYLVPYTRQLLERRAKLAGRTDAQTVGAAAEEVLDAVAGVVGGGSRRRSGSLGSRREHVDATGALANGKGKGKEKEREPRTREQRRNATIAEAKASDDSVWLQCAVGEPMEDAEEEMATSAAAAVEDKEQTPQIVPLQGFDRLRDAGFSEEDIESMRAEFRRSRQAAGVETSAPGGDDDEHARALEDQWMEGLTGQDEAAAAADLSRQDRYWSTMLQGVCVGFFVPFLPFFFFRAQLFSRTMSIAIVLGAFINLMFGLLRMFS